MISYTLTIDVPLPDSATEAIEAVDAVLVACAREILPTIVLVSRHQPHAGLTRSGSLLPEITIELEP